MRVLGIETSCDDTAVAVVEGGAIVRSNVVSSQTEHAAFGGIVPEIAARKHVENLPAILDRALADADCDLDDLDGVAVTRGPGLIGALLAGWCFGRGLAQARELPYVGVHHLAAHVHGGLMPTLERGESIQYPLLALVVSGGHTALYQSREAEHFRLVGQTRDDAAGEAFDKVASLLGLGFPGGPVIDALAEGADGGSFPLPRPDLGTDFSFSGLKTAVRRAALAAEMKPGEPDRDSVRDLVASFQQAVVDVLVATTARALDEVPARGLVLAGGVAANRALRAAFAALAERRSAELYRCPPSLATDNAAMIAGAAWRRLAGGERDPLDLGARASWPLA